MFVLLWTCFNAQTCACYSRNYTQIRLTVLGEWIIFWKKCGSSANVTYIPPVCVNFGTEHFFCCRLNIFDRWSEWHWSLCYTNSCGFRIHMDVTLPLITHWESLNVIQSLRQIQIFGDFKIRYLDICSIFCLWHKTYTNLRESYLCMQQRLPSGGQMMQHHWRGWRVFL